MPSKSDQLFRKRKGTPSRRRGETRKPSLRILIVCEGEKTEPAYLGHLLQILQLGSVKVKGLGKDPVKLAEYGRDRAEEFDKVFIVFDRDQHSNIPAAQAIISQNEMKEIISSPCFEFWLLLHFLHTTASFTDCRAVKAALKEQQGFSNYSKLDSKHCDILMPRLEQAMANAALVLQSNTSIGGNANISETSMPVLIDCLEKLKTP